MVSAYRVGIRGLRLYARTRRGHGCPRGRLLPTPSIGSRFVVPLSRLYNDLVNILRADEVAWWVAAVIEVADKTTPPVTADHLILGKGANPSSHAAKLFARAALLIRLQRTGRCQCLAAESCGGLLARENLFPADDDLKTPLFPPPFSPSTRLISQLLQCTPPSKSALDLQSLLHPSL